MANIYDNPIMRAAIGLDQLEYPPRIPQVWYIVDYPDGHVELFTLFARFIEHLAACDDHADILYRRMVL